MIPTIQDLEIRYFLNYVLNKSECLTNYIASLNNIGNWDGYDVARVSTVSDHVLYSAVDVPECVNTLFPRIRYDIASLESIDQCESCEGLNKVCIDFHIQDSYINSHRLLIIANCLREIFKQNCDRSMGNLSEEQEFKDYIQDINQTCTLPLDCYTVNIWNWKEQNYTPPYREKGIGKLSGSLKNEWQLHLRYCVNISRCCCNF